MKYLIIPNKNRIKNNWKRFQEDKEMTGKRIDAKIKRK